MFIFYKIFNLSTNKFRQYFTKIYTILLHTNRLSFNILPGIIKYFIIHISNLEHWTQFFRRVKNAPNLYVIREKKYKINNWFWILYYREYNKYYYELNVNRRSSLEISNFFYKTRICFKDVNLDYVSLRKTHINLINKSNKSINYKSVFFYFFNKCILNNYPYFYWMYDLTYNKYGLRPTSVQTSHHIRTHLFFLFIQNIKIFFKKKKKVSFIKLTVDTFKGVHNTFLFVFSRIAPEFVKKRKISTAKNKLAIEDNTKILYKSIFVKLVYFYGAEKIKNLSLFFTKMLFINSAWNQKKNIIFFKIFQKNIKQLFPIVWYNKLYNISFNKKKLDIILYLRSSKHFNKGRYSRNRQLYRTGVYWCIWLNVVIVYGLYFYFYRFVFSFGYFWLPIGFLVLSVFSSRLYKYRYYNINQLVVEFHEYIDFLFYFWLKLKIQIRNIYLNSNKTKIWKIFFFVKKYVVNLLKFSIQKSIKSFNKNKKK